jgi:hypothetical protein
VPVRHRHREPVLVGSGRQQYGGRLGVGHLARTPGDQVQHLACLDSGEQTAGDLAERLQPALPAAAGVVHARVVDGDPGRVRQRGQDGLVVGVELSAAAFLGQAEVAEHLVPYADGPPGTYASGDGARENRNWSDAVSDPGGARGPGCGSVPRGCRTRRGLANAGRELVGDAHRQELGQPHAHQHLGEFEASTQVRDGLEEVVRPLRNVEPKP